MPLEIVRNDITKMNVDAIVNAANTSLLGGGGVDGAIHRAAGPQLLEECRALHGCATGEAKITKGYNLPCRYVIHTVGPVWHGGLLGEKRLLASCYRSALELARQHGCESVAFPMISTGAYGYPAEKALRVALDEIGAFLLENEMTVYIVVFSSSSVMIGKKLFADIRQYIDDQYADRYLETRGERARCAQSRRLADGAFGDTAPIRPLSEDDIQAFEAAREEAPQEEICESVGYQPDDDAFAWMTQKELSLEEVLGRIDESFQQMLLRKIDESGMKDAECYKRANISRKLFSKIRGNTHYKPTKATALAFAIALRMELSETKELLGKAGYALSRSSRFDLIVEYFIMRGIYDVDEINQALFSFDQPLLGGGNVA